MAMMFKPLVKQFQRLCPQILKLSLIRQQRMLLKYFSDDIHNPKHSDEKNVKLGDMGAKYRVFKDEDSEVILDLYEERLKKHSMQEDYEEVDPFEGISLERGMDGVYDVEDLVEVLKRENSEDIFVAEVPKDIKYVDYICVVTGKSQRHMHAIAQFVRRVYKKKRKSGKDIVPKLEGENSKDWMALDLGNIALHIFSREARVIYDLDSLWAVGPQFDKECNKQDPIVDMLEKHSVYLKDLQPAS